MKYLVGLFLCFSANAYEQIRVGFIDDGFSWRHWEAGTALPLCKNQHYVDGGPEDTFGVGGKHGTATVKAFLDFVQPGVNYCVVIFNARKGKELTFKSVSRALGHALKSDLDVLNVSLEGSLTDLVEEEKMRKLGTKGTRIYVAAGNRSIDLGASCISYPACYLNIPNMYVVGALAGPFTPAEYSNYGERVNIWMPGTVILRGKEHEGTSFASPRAMALYVNLLHLQRSKTEQ